MTMIADIITVSRILFSLLQLVFHRLLITSLIHYCDREPEKEPEIMRQIEAYVRHFIKTYIKG